MDKTYYASVAQLVCTVVLFVGLLITNSSTVLFAESNAVYVIAMLIELMLLAMLFSNIFCVLFSFAMWEKNELNEENYNIFNRMVLLNTFFIPVVLALFGVIVSIRTENKYLLGLLSYNSRCIAHTIESVYFCILLIFTIFALVLQISRKCK